MIKRYNRYIMPNYHQGVIHSHQGEFVKYEDHLAEVERLKEAHDGCSMDYAEMVYQRDQLQARVEELENIVAATRGRCACRFDDDDNIVEWCKFHSDERNKLQAKNDALWETLIAIADHLEIDPESSRRLAGKPSDVYIAAINRSKAK